MRGVPEPCLNEYTRINIQMTPGQAVRLIPSGFSRISISDALDIGVLEYRGDPPPKRINNKLHTASSFR